MLDESNPIPHPKPKPNPHQAAADLHEKIALLAHAHTTRGAKGARYRGDIGEIYGRYREM